MFRAYSAIAISALLTLTACATNPTATTAQTQLQSKSGSAVQGQVMFKQAQQGVEVSGRILGLKPNQEHGFHVHEKGDCSSADGLSAGGHFNPLGAAHGHHSGPSHHAGDMPNLMADATGTAAFKFVLNDVTLQDGKSSILNRAVIVHMNPDDYTSQPVGNAGGRIACGVISAN